MEKITITVVVNGQAAVFPVDGHLPLHALISRAVAETGNTGQPPENWELRDQNGVVIDSAKKVLDYGFTSGVKLFLSPKAGIGGYH